MKRKITSHLLDVSLGQPAIGVACRLERQTTKEDWKLLGASSTDPDGRVNHLTSDPLQKGVYRLTFETMSYFKSRKVETFYPSIQVQFEVTNTDEHYHIPLLLSPYGYSTYRGS